MTNTGETFNVNGNIHIFFIAFVENNVISLKSLMNADGISEAISHRLLSLGRNRCKLASTKLTP